MAKLGTLAWIALLAVACSADPGDAPDGGNEPPDPCEPDDRVGVCPPRGVFVGPVSVELKAPEASDAIHFTLDASEPTKSSPRYDSVPLELSAEGGGPVVRTLRAIAFHADGSRTEVVTHTYVFRDAVLQQPAAPSGFPLTWGFGGDTIEGDYEMDTRVLVSDDDRVEASLALATIPSVALTLAHDDLWAPSSGIYMRPSASGSDFERSGSVEVLFPNGKSTAARAGIRIQGGSSTVNWKAAKLSMRLEFRGPHADAPLLGALFSEDNETFSNLILDAHLNHTWIHPDVGQRRNALYARDQFVSRLLSEAGSLAPRSQPVHVYLNGLYWGLYDLHERPDAHFAASHLGESPTGWDVLRHDASTVVSGDSTRYEELLSLARAGLNNDARFQEISEQVAIDELINYMLINFYVGNTDWDHHNWYAVGRRQGGAAFRFVSWDAERVLEDLNDNIVAVENNGAPSEIYRALLASPTFRSRLAERATELYEPGGVLYVNAASPQWDETSPQNNEPARLFVALTDELRSHILLESARWGDNRSRETPYTRSDWDAVRARLLADYFPSRSAIAAAQLPSP